MVAKRKTGKMLQRFVFNDKTDYSRNYSPRVLSLYAEDWWQMAD